MTDFRSVFEATAPQMIAAAWDYLERSEAVDLIWVYVSQDEGVYTCNSYFKVNGEILDHYEAAKRVGADSSHEAQRWLSGQMDEPVARFREASTVSEVPNRMILQFRPADSDFHADFYYGSLWPGMPDDDRPSLSAVERDWFARLKTTGNASAGV